MTPVQAATQRKRVSRHQPPASVADSHQHAKEHVRAHNS